MDFVVRGRLQEFDVKFFEDDVPIVGDEQNPKVCVKSVIRAEDGQFPIKMWDAAASATLGLGAGQLQNWWEEGNEVPGKQLEALQSLNKNMDAQFNFLCTARVWGTPERKKLDINVNNAEKVDNSEF